MSIISLLINSDAKAASERLKDTLRKVPPWAKEVEVHRQRYVPTFCSNLSHADILGVETCC